jgi:phosphate-selective porin OprO/OprP
VIESFQLADTNNKEGTMKLKIAAAAVLTTAIFANGASAKTLEDVLKEKGVITEEDYKEVTKVKPIDYKLGKGFTFTSQDEKFQLSLGGRMQLRYTFYDYDSDRTDNDYSQFDAKKVRLWAQGYAYSKNLTYNLEFDPRAYGSDNKKGLINAYIDYKIIDEAQIRVGQFKDSFGRQEVISDANLEFADRSPVADAFKHGYDIGAMLYGKIAGGLVTYNTGVFGGAGQTNTRNSNDNAFYARVAVNPLGDMAYTEGDLDVSQKPLLSIGVNYLNNTFNKTTSGTTASFDSTASNVSSTGWLPPSTSFGNARDKIETFSYGGDLAFKWMGASLQGEYLLGEAEARHGDQKQRAHGYYAQAGYVIIPKTLELAFRYSYLDKNRDADNNLITETIGAISYYFDKHNLKIQGDVGNIHTQKTVSGAHEQYDDMQYRLQAQVIF